MMLQNFVRLWVALQSVVLGVGTDADCAMNDIDLSSSSHSSYSLPSTSVISATIPESVTITPVEQKIPITIERLPKAQSTPVKEVASSKSLPLRSSPRINARLLKESSEESKLKSLKCITSDNLKQILNERIGGKVLLYYYQRNGKLNHLKQVNLAKYTIDVEWNNSLNNKIETSVECTPLEKFLAAPMVVKYLVVEVTDVLELKLITIDIAS